MSSYIGKNPAYGVFSKQAETGDGSTTAYTLNYTTADATQLIVSVGGVLQEPRIAYTINAAGNTLTFTEAPGSSTSIWIIWLGRQLTGPRVTADAITSQVALGTSPAAADTFLMYDENVGDLKKVAYSDLESDTANMPANSVKVRDAATTGVPSNKTVTDTQILIGDGTGFTAAALSGDVTMANTGAVSLAATQSNITALGTIASLVATTADINGGTFDGIVGGTTPAAVSATQVDITAQGDLRLQDTTGGEYVAIQAAGTTSTYTITMPAAVASTTGQALTSSDAGVASWSDVGDASVGTANEWTAQQNFNNTTLTFDATQDWALTANQVATLTLTANTTFDAPTQMVDGAFYSLIIIQDGTGSRTASWNGVFKWAAATAPTLTTTASAKDIFVWRSDGTNMYEVGRQLNVS